MRAKRALPIATACALSLLAQDPVIHVTTRMVEVNVIVRDHHGPVAGLGKDDFTIFDKGKPQKVAFFSANSAGSNAPPALKSVNASVGAATSAKIFTNRPGPRAEGVSNVTVVLLDGLNTRIQDQIYAKQQFIKFLAQIRPEDHIAIYTLGNGLRVLQDFSSDSRRLVAAVAKFRGENLPFVDTSEPDPADSGDLALDMRMNDFLGAIADQAITNRVRMTSAALIAIANHIGHLPGRKSLVWVSASFPFSLSACGGENPTDWNKAITEISMQASGTPGQPDCMAMGQVSSGDSSGKGGRGSRSGPSAGGMPAAGPSAFMMPSRDNVVFAPEIRGAMQALNSANVAIYPVDARGLISMPKSFTAAMGSVTRSLPGGSGPAAHTDMAPTGISVMEMVASDTGGHAFYNTNDIQGAIRKSIDDAEVTYTLGFYPDSKALDSQYHSLKVQVNRKDVEVRSRKGYVASVDAVITETDREQIVRDALWSPLAATGIGLSATADRVDQPRPDSMKIVLTIDLDQLQFRLDGEKRKAEVQIAFEQRSAEGKALGTTEQVAPVVLDEDRYRSRQPITLTKTLPLSNGVSEIRVALYDRRSENVGSLVIPVAGKNSTSR
jgi:VWFA-related protein